MANAECGIGEPAKRGIGETERRRQGDMETRSVKGEVHRAWRKARRAWRKEGLVKRNFENPAGTRRSRTQ